LLTVRKPISMKHITTLCIIALAFYSQSQKKDTTFTIHYHSNKKISTKKVNLTNDLYWGYAKAYDRAGKEIYSMGIRNVGGHASVNFTYYPDGAVQKAHFSSHPDGGIQWSDVTHYFDENGKVTQVIDNSSDDYGRYTLKIDPTFKSDTSRTYLTSPVKIETPKKQEVVACAEIYTTTFYLINATGKKRKAIATLLNAQIEGFQKELVLAKNDTIQLGSYIEAQLFTHPKERVSLQIEGRKSEKIQLFWEEPKQLSKSSRKYFVIAIKR